MASRRRGYSTQQVIDAIFALPSDDESEDDGEGSDDDDLLPDADADADSDDESDADSDTLYRLADESVDEHETDDDVPSHCSDDEVDSDADEDEWSKQSFASVSLDFDAVPVTPRMPFSPDDRPVDFFRKFFDNDVFDILVQQTNLYARQNKLRNWEDTTVTEMQAFVALLIGMGIHCLPHVDLYWSSDTLYRVQPIADVMTVKRFKKIRQGLHLNDNSKAPKRGDANFDKLYKLRLITKKMNTNFQQQGVSSSSQSIDEAMIIFKGRNSMKQYMPLKPIKKGFKVWMRCDSETGYVYQFSIYTGRDKSDDAVAGLGAKVVMQLTNVLQCTGTHVTFDNYFTSVALLEELLNKNIYATATVRPNRVDLPVLARKKVPMDRGEFKWRSRNNMNYVQWMDTKAVHVVSTAFDPVVTSDISRRQKDGTLTAVVCPSSVVQYTRRMGGVDRFDHRRSSYSVSRRSRKWWMRIFYFILDSCITNAFVLYTAVFPDIDTDMLQFRRSLFLALLDNYSSRKRKSNITGSMFIRRRASHEKMLSKKHGVPPEVRLSRVGVHFPTLTPKFLRCRLCSSRTVNRRSRVQCTTCRVALCINCFEDFHK